MKKMYIVTGADGHLGGTVVRMLEQEDCLVRGLILPGEEGVNWGNVVYYRGDVAGGKRCYRFLKIQTIWK